MESYTFKTVTFGGFDKQDVARYLEQLTQEHSAALAALKEENAALKEKTSHLEAENRSLHTQTSAQAASLSQLNAQAEKLLEEVASLRDYPEKYAALRAEADALRPDAQAYVEFRNRIGNIECEAQQRAAKLEADTQAQLRRMAESFRTQYEALTATFDAAAAHVTAELRKVEVNLSQLPRSLDPVRRDLEKLDSILDGKSPQ